MLVHLLYSGYFWLSTTIYLSWQLAIAYICLKRQDTIFYV